MRKVLILTFIFVATQVVFADFNTFETKQDAYDRQSYENYQVYKSNNNNAPLGGYNRPINDNGGKQYGYTNSQGMNSINSYNSLNNQNSRGLHF